MADIATIGFRAETGDLDKAKQKMEQLVPSAGKAERASERLSKMFDRVDRAAEALQAAANGLSAAADKLSNASGRAATAQEKKARSINNAAAAANKATKASNAAAAAANDEAAAVNKAAAANDKLAASRKRTSVPSVGAGSRFNDTPNGGMGPWGMRNPAANDNGGGVSEGAFKANVGNIAAQFQDIGVTAAMGMNPLLIALQQGTQLSMALGGGLKSLGAAFMMVLSPTALLTIALVALAAAGLQMVEWTKLAQWGLNALADVLPEVALGITAVGAAITIAFAPAILTAFWNIFVTMAAGIVAAIGAIVAAVGWIPLVIGLVIADLYIFRDEWTQLLGFDLISVVYDAANMIIGSFVAAYDDIIFTWNNFPNIIGAAAIGAANLVIKAVNAIIAAGVAGINKLIAAADALGGSSIMKTLGIGFEIGQYADGAGEIPLMANDAAAALETAVADRNKKLKETLEKDYLGAMGSAITSAATTAAGKLREFSAGLDDDDKKKKKKGGGGKTEGERFEDIVRGAERSITSMQAEKDAIGLTAEAAAKLKYETELLNKAQQANINLTPVQREQLMQLAGQMATLEIETERAKEALDFSKSLTKGFMNDFIQGIKDGESVWKSFGKAALGVLDKIGQKLVDMAIDNLFSGLGSGKGGGGLFGGLFGGLGKLLFNAKGNAFPGGINGHSNTVVDRPTLFAFASGAGVMGEAGPEAIMPLKRGPDGSLGVQMHNSGASSNSGPASNSVVVENNFTLEGVVSEEAMKQRIQAAAEITKEQTKKEMVGWLNQYNQDGAFA